MAPLPERVAQPPALSERPAPAPMPPLDRPAPSPNLAPPAPPPGLGGPPRPLLDSSASPAPGPLPVPPEKRVTISPSVTHPPASAPAPAPGPLPGSSPPIASPAPHPRVIRTASNPPASAPSRPSRPQAVVGSRGLVIDPLDPKLVKMLELQQSILDRLVPKLELDDIPVDRLGDEALWQRAESAIVDMVETMDSAGEVPNYVDQDMLIKETLNEALGLGALEDLLADEKIDEIIVDRRDRIIVGKGGALRSAGRAFSSDDAFRRVVERLVAPTGHLIDEAHPFIDVRLRDGSRLAAAVPPVAVRGACLTLRKPRGASFTLSDLIARGTLSSPMGDFLATCIQARKNILICGAPGTGKSSLLGALAASSPPGERIVSVEEVAELHIDRDDWIGLESRPGDGNGVHTVDMETLLRGALRMRPDRLVVGDIRGLEALELVSAMASSNDGTLASASGENSQAALARLTSMARLAAPGSSVAALRELIACAVDVVVHVARYADGIHRIASIEEVLGVNEDGFRTQPVFGFRGEGAGGFSAAGVIPTFYADLEARGISADTSIFRA